LARKKYSKTRAAVRIVAFMRWARSKYYIKTVLAAFKGVETTPDFGLKTITWPPAPPVLQKGLEMMQSIQSRWWAHEKLKTVPNNDMPYLEQKVLAFDLFHNNKPWNPARCWEATYLERDSNPHRAAYTKSMQKLFNKYNDQNVMFCDYMDKRNSKNKMQRRVIVVTESNIYKQDPKKFTIAQEPIPIVSITDVVITKGPDQLVVLHTAGQAKHPDLLLDLACGRDEEGKERMSEFVTVLFQVYTNVTGNPLKIVLQDNTDWRSKGKGKPAPISLPELESDLDKKRKAAATTTTTAVKKPGTTSPQSPRKEKDE